MKTRTRILLAALLFISGWIGLSLFVGPHRYPGFSSTISPTNGVKHFKIGQQDFWIPDGYSDTVSESGFFIMALLPDFEPLTKENYDVFMKVGGDESRVVTILVNDADQTSNLEYRKPIIVSSAEPLIQNGYKYRLKFFKPAGQRSNNYTLKEIYSDENDNLIACDIKEYVISPGCAQHFQHKNYVFEINYRKRFLKDWDQLRKKSTELVVSFMLHP